MYTKITKKKYKRKNKQKIQNKKYKMYNKKCGIIFGLAGEPTIIKNDAIQLPPGVGKVVQKKKNKIMDRYYNYLLIFYEIYG